LLLLDICVLSGAPVFADSTHFDFVALCPSSAPCALNAVLPSPHTFMENGLSIELTGYHSFKDGKLENMWMNSRPADHGELENGIGLEKSGSNHEIAGSDWIQLSMAPLLASIPANHHLVSLTLSLDSIQSGTGDSYNIFGSNTAANVGTDQLHHEDTDHLVTIDNPQQFQFIDITAEGGDILLEDAKVATTTARTLEPGSGGLLLIGLGAGALVAAGTRGKKRPA
jgi:hypothetical protein